MRKFPRASLLPVLGLMLSAMLCSGCDDDSNYVYPSVLTEFVDAHVDSSHLVDKITTDQAYTYTLENSISASGLQADSTYRSVCIYEKSSTEANQAKVYSLRLIYALAPVPAERFTTIKTDPLSMQSLWRGGEYLNMVATPKAQNIDHVFAFIQDSLITDNGCTKLYLKLYHDQNGDLEAYTQKTYLSVPLSDYSLQEGDSIYFRAYTYKEGLKTWKFAY